MSGVGHTAKMSATLYNIFSYFHGMVDTQGIKELSKVGHFLYP